MPYLTLPYLTFGVGKLLHLPRAEAVSVRPNAQPRCNQKVTVIGCEAEQIISHLGLVMCSMVCSWLAPLLQITNRPGHWCISPTTTTRWQTSVGMFEFDCTTVQIAGASWCLIVPLMAALHKYVI